MFIDKVDALILFEPGNRYFFTKLKTSFGCVIISDTQKTFITDARYETYAKQQLKDWRVAITTQDKFYDTLKQEAKKFDTKNFGYEDETLTVALHKQLKTYLDDYTLRPIGNYMVMQRSIKTPEQIAFMQEAQKITESALKKVISIVKAGVTEKDISAEIMYEIMRGGADGLAFDTIVAFGENAAKPHHIPTFRKLEKDDVILIDIGAKFNGFCSDMTRTFALNQVQRGLETAHARILETIDYVKRNIKPGMTGHEVDSLAREMLKASGFDKEFCHGLGHGVGTNVHEYPRLGNKSEDILRENMVVTIEPGVYIESSGGIRVEDLVAITADGCKTLTNFSNKLYL